MNLIGNINVIPFRRFRGGGGVAPFPSIPGMIARYSASGLTNEQMKENPVWVDKTGNGHDLQMKNFAWSGMSGVSGYVVNFKTWGQAVTRGEFTTTDSKIHITKSNIARFPIVYIQQNNNKFQIKVTGVNSQHVIKVDGTNLLISEDGYYTIDKMGYIGFGTAKILDSCDITIEQLPLYPGALVFDGVDDYGICDNFPILTKEKGYTVVALRQWITYNPNAISAIATNASDRSFNGAFTFENYNKGAEQTISYGATQITLQYSKSPFSWQTTSKYNGVNIANGNKDATNSLVLGRSYPQRNEFANFAIWELVFLDHDATEEELTKIKDYFVKTYPWLFPDQAWTVTGKTNEDKDRATIANITGNGNDLVLSNFGFAEGSGYGLYKTPFELYPSVQHSSKYSLSFSKFALGDHNLIIAPKQNDLSYDIKVKVTGLKDGVKFKWGWIGTTGYIDITTDGIHMLNKPASQIRQLIVEFAEDFDPDHVVTIEQIPEYEGYLITDGVDDKITSSTFEMGNDWTVIGDWELINTGKNDNAGIVKFDSIVIYNHNYNYNSMLINIKNGRNILIPDQNTVNAICSDGRIYSKDWKESIYNEETESTSKNFLTIGYSGNVYTKIAFKNLAIYPTVLSREDCIKAYNYLQTLKSK